MAMCFGVSKIIMRTIIISCEAPIYYVAFMGTTCNASEDRRISTVLICPHARCEREDTYHNRCRITPQAKHSKGTYKSMPPCCLAEKLVNPYALESNTPPRAQSIGGKHPPRNVSLLCACLLTFFGSLFFLAPLATFTLPSDAILKHLFTRQ